MLCKLPEKSYAGICKLYRTLHDAVSLKMRIAQALGSAEYEVALYMQACRAAGGLTASDKGILIKVAEVQASNFQV